MISTALENVTTCNMKENSLFRCPSTFQNTLQLGLLEASPCQAIKERAHWWEMVVLIDLWWETPESERRDEAVRGRGGGTGFAHEHIGHHLETPQTFGQRFCRSLDD